MSDHLGDHRNPDRTTPHDRAPQTTDASSNTRWIWVGVFLIVAFIFVMYMMADGQLRFASNSEAPTTTVERQSGTPNPPNPIPAR
jgi:hypothetical protein